MRKLGIIGLGYVGLPLAVEFGKIYQTIGFDINICRIKDLKQGIDKTLEVEKENLTSSTMLTFTDELQDLSECNIFIVTVPTPIDSNKQPDLSPLFSASKSIGNILKKDDIVIYESTVFPGATEEECVPILEKESGLVFNKDFYVGYSPERINPGDKKHGIRSILKVTSGSTPEIATEIDNLYKEIIDAGTFQASSIKVAEAAKVIENTQRDINISLMNELSKIFNLMDIDTNEVIDAASTKWNFLPFRPGLVGGHCIGVDPYYLTYKANALNYYPEVILSGRRLNDGMAEYVSSTLVKRMISNKININNSNILVAGITFKENCPDIRNTKVIEIVENLELLNANVEILDPWVHKEEIPKDLQAKLVSTPKKKKYDSIVIAVPHKEFIEMGSAEFKDLAKSNAIIFDLKGAFDIGESDLRL